jgi:hypothetical protein
VNLSDATFASSDVDFQTLHRQGYARFYAGVRCTPEGARGKGPLPLIQ